LASKKRWRRAADCAKNDPPLRSRCFGYPAAELVDNEQRFGIFPSKSRCAGEGATLRPVLMADGRAEAPPVDVIWPEVTAE